MITSKQIQNSITNAKEVLLKNSVQIGILIVLVIVVSLFFHQGRGLQYSYQVDDIARDPVIAPFNFPILKTEEKQDSCFLKICACRKKIYWDSQPKDLKHF